MYLASWVVGAGVLGSLGISLLGALVESNAWPIEPPLLGAAFGIGIGLLLAHACAARPAVHRRLHHAGGWLCLALPVAVAMWWWSELERTTGTYLAGFVEMMTAWLCLILGVAGIAFLLAGISGRKLTTA